MREKRDTGVKGRGRRLAVSRIKKHKLVFAVYLVLRLVVIGILILSATRGRWENVFICLLALVLFMLPDIIQRSLKIKLPSTLEILVLFFIFAAEILGELECYYINVPHWDSMLHTINGFICAAIGFSLVDILNRNKKIRFELSPFFLAVVAFCFSMTIGVLWEFYEFGSDYLFHTDMQKDTVIHVIDSTYLDPTKSNSVVSIKDINDTVVAGESLGVGGYLDIGLIDTMKDLIVNFIGATVFSVIGYFYVKHRGRSKIAQQFIPVVDENGDGIDDYLQTNEQLEIQSGERTEKTNDRN